MVFSDPYFEIIFQVFLATLFGSIIGLERELKKREAGLQTFSLVCLGSCVLTLVSLYLQKTAGQAANIIMVVQAVAVGIGFIGAGTIFRDKGGIEGLTTAAALWTTAAIGITVGAGFYCLSFFAAFFSLLVLVGFGILEDKLLPRNRE